MDSKSNKTVEFHHEALDQTQSSIRLVEVLPNHMDLSSADYTIRPLMMPTIVYLMCGATIARVV